MIRILFILAAASVLAACGRNEAPDQPLYEIDQTAPADLPDPALDGRWEAALTTSVEPRPLVLTVDLSAEPPQVSMTSPSQGGAAIAFEQVRLDGPSIALATRLGAFRFQGALAGADRIEGQVFQGGLRDALIFRRAGDSGQGDAEPPR